MLHALFCLLAVFSLYRLSQRGYPLLALMLLPVATMCCWRLASQRLAGAFVCWHRGEWTLERRGTSRALRIDPRSTCIHWVIYLAWTEVASGRRGSVFLLPDSAPADQLRRLRVRLTLER